ncbi:hypothetical protein B0A50_03307 [Salinomyces thailandicus]|uniref:Trafficking protein particle complex subunit n=1 Tax=Salinomyces thailandicus TaxID=706561 RepID=A0A4U0U386_9PEZI|nr:hypothetical protein B0A50_03307 [Salinomyces thailandica]
MSVYSFFIFDRHTECIYSRRWVDKHLNASNRPNSSALGHGDVPATAKKAMKDRDDVRSPALLPTNPPHDRSFPDSAANFIAIIVVQAKLIFGTLFSLRRMVRQLGGSEDQFLSYRTGEYKLHYFETPTQLKFVMLTDTRVGNMRTVLYQIWATLYVEYVVKSPLSPTEHPGGLGVANELFEGGLERFIESIFGVPQTTQ